MVHSWSTRTFSVWNLCNPRLYQCSNEDHEGRKLRLAGRLFYLILESLKLNRLLRNYHLWSHHCLTDKMSNLKPLIFLKSQVEAGKWCLIVEKYCMLSVTSSSNTFDPTRILECFLKYQSKSLILDHQENMNFLYPGDYPTDKLLCHPKKTNRWRVFRRSAQSGFLPKLENVPKIFTAFIWTQVYYF